MTNDYKLASLMQKQALPLEGKIILTQQRIREWYDHWQGQVCVSFSGGKDSTVLKHLVETTSGVDDVPSVFVNTGLEFPEIRMFAQSQPNVITVMPEMRFDKVIETYGYPVGTKSIAHLIDAHQRGLPWAKQYVTGEAVKADGTPSRYNLSKRWSILTDAPFKVSDKCCSIMKKAPLRAYQKETGRKPYIGTMACESLKRKKAYLDNGCNAYKSSDPKSQPMSFWTEQDVLEYILKYNLDYCSVYGEIKRDENGKLYTTGRDRTGCVFCMFGCHLEKAPNRFQQLKETHPRQYAYCMKSKEEGGLGLAEVLDYIGVPYE